MSESYWEEEANSLEIQLSELQEKYEELEQQKAELYNLLNQIAHTKGIKMAMQKLIRDTLRKIDIT
jgi:hypothetical protein